MRALYGLNGDAVNASSTQANTVNKLMLDKLRCTATVRLRVTKYQADTRRTAEEGWTDKLATVWHTEDDHSDKQSRNSQRRMQSPDVARLTLGRNGNDGRRRRYDKPGLMATSSINHHATNLLCRFPLHSEVAKACNDPRNRSGRRVARTTLFRRDGQSATSIPHLQHQEG